MKSLVLTLPFTLLLVACPSKDGDEHAPGATGEAMFHTYCDGCHGEEGEGRLFRGVPSNRDTILRGKDVAKLLMEGLPGHPKMKPFPKLDRHEATQIARYLEVLRKRHQR